MKINFEIGKEAPVPVPEGAQAGGALADFLRSDIGNYLFIYLPELTEEEVAHLAIAKLQAGFFADGCFLLWLFKFDSQLIEAPFNLHANPSPVIPDPKKTDFCLPINLVVIDPMSNIVKVTRQLSLASQTTSEFGKACEGILKHGFDVDQFTKAFQNAFSQSLGEAGKDVEFLPCGN